MLTKHRILFIGAGRMAEAIFSGLLKTSKRIHRRDYRF